MPGFHRESTQYSEEGKWFDGDRVRFREGKPENLRGYQKKSDTAIIGTSRVLENPSNAVIGQCGSIYIIQSVSGAATKTISFGDAYRFKAGAAPTITQTTSAVDLMVYNVRDVSIVDILPVQNLKPEV